MSDWRRGAAIVWKDVLCERRSKAAFNGITFFAALLLFIFSFAVGPDMPTVGARGGTLLQYLWPGLLWVALFFAGVLALGRSFQVEIENGGLEALRLYPGSRMALYGGKLVANLIVLGALALLLVPLSAILYSVDLWSRLPALLGVILSGLVGYAAAGTLYAALTANLRAREVMLPLFLFPIQVPILVGSVKATVLVLWGDPLGELSSWLRLVFVADLVLVAVCAVLFEYAIEE